MPRPLRIDYPGAQHHVMNRGPRKQTLFFDDEDRVCFLATLGELPERFGVLPEAYALMRSHYHAQLLSQTGRLSEAMQFLGSRYGAWLNRKHGWDGSVCKGRFRNRLAVRDSHLLHLPVYIHLNPDPEHPERIDDMAWTSHRAWVGLDPCPTWLHPESLLELHGGVAGYRRYIAARTEAPEGFGEVWGPPASQVIGQVDTDPRTLLQLVAAVHGSSLEDLRSAHLGCRGDPAGAMAAWCLCTLGGMSATAAAAFLGIAPSTASRRIRTWKARWSTEREPAHRLETILAMLRARAA